MKLTTIIGVNANDSPDKTAKGNASAENKYRLIHNEADNTVSNASSVDSFSNILTHSLFKILTRFVLLNYKIKEITL